MGVLFQEGGLFDSMTIEDNVAYPLVERRQSRDRKTAIPAEKISCRVHDALRFVELEQTLANFQANSREACGGAPVLRALR